MSVWDTSYVTPMELRPERDFGSQADIVFVLADPAHVSTVLLWLKLVRRDLPDASWEVILTMPQAEEVRRLAFPTDVQSHCRAVEGCTDCPAVMAYLPASGLTLHGKATETAWDEVVSRLGADSNSRVGPNPG